MWISSSGLWYGLGSQASLSRIVSWLVLLYRKVHGGPLSPYEREGGAQGGVRLRGRVVSLILRNVVMGVRCSVGPSFKVKSD